MRKLSSLLILAIIPSALVAQTQTWEDVTIVEHSYGQKISSNGVWTVGFPADGGTVVYNRITGLAEYYPYANYSKGRVVSDNGMVVGNQMVDEEVTRAIVMKGGEAFTPNVFDTSVSGNIHSITPDGSRICGVVGNRYSGQSYLPFYCDIDEKGNFGPLQYLPYAEEDLFGARPQYCSATWISADGKTIAGQVVDARGYAVYPILYKQQTDQNWEISFPSENYFNMKGLPLPGPEPEMEELYPDVPYPTVEEYMSAEEYGAFILAGSPYDELGDFMSQENLDAYYNAVDKYEEAQAEFFEIWWDWDEKYWEVYDDSLLFVRNAMALSPDGNWLASSAQVDDLTNPESPQGYYIPYLCDLKNEEWIKIGPEKESYHVNQVLPGGMTVMNNFPEGDEPVSTFIYMPATKELINLLDYLATYKASAVKWIEKYLTADIIIGVESDGITPIYKEDVTFTGQVVFSDDSTVMAGGVDGYVMKKDMYFTYIMDGLTSKIQDLSEDTHEELVYNVFNLQGLKVVSTKDVNTIHNLKEGIYIINGKKVMVK